MSQFQRDYYSVVRGRHSSPVRSRGRYSSRLLTHGPNRIERCLSLSPAREISARDRGRSLLPTRDDDRIRSLSMNDIHCCDDPKCILPAELHDEPELRLDRKSRKLAPTSKISRGCVSAYESTEPSRRSNRSPFSGPNLSIIYGRESRSFHEPLETRVRLPSYGRKRRLSRSPSVVPDSIGYGSRSDRRKFQDVERRHSSPSPARDMTLPRPVNRTHRDSPEIRFYRTSGSPNRGTPRVIPRGGSSTTVRLDRSSARDIQVSSKPSSKKPITRIIMPPPTNIRRPSRPALKEVKNQAKPVKKVRFIDEKFSSFRQKPEAMTPASGSSSTSLVVSRKKVSGTSTLLTIGPASRSQPRALPGDPVLRRRRIE